MKLSSRGQAPCSIGFPLLAECSWNPPVSVSRLTLWAAVFGFSEFFGLFPCICPFHDGWFTSAPAHTVLSGQQFLTKTSMIPMPHPPYSSNLTRVTFFFVSLDEKSPQRETFCRCGTGESKNGRSTKRHQNWWAQKLFWAVEKMSQQVYCIKWRVFEGDWSLNM